MSFGQNMHVCTFGHKSVLSRAGQRAVDLADQLHVVQKGVEGVEVREANQVRGAATCSLAEDKQRMSHKRFPKDAIIIH